MKRPSENRLIAMQFEAVELTPEHRHPRRRQLFALQGVPGVFRRVVLSSGDRPVGHVIAVYGDVEIELTRATDVEEELKQAGFVHVAIDVNKLSASQRQVVLDNLFDDDEEQHPDESDDSEDDCDEDCDETHDEESEPVRSVEVTEEELAVADEQFRAMVQ